MNANTLPDDIRLSELYPDHLNIIKKRHDLTLERGSAEHLVIFSGTELPVFLDDTYYPFRPNPHFLAWVPIPSTNCYIVYTPGHRPILIYYQEKDYWHLPPANPEGFWTRHFDIRIVNTLEEVEKHLPNDHSDTCSLIGEVSDQKYAFGIKRINQKDFLNVLHYNRSVKTSYELECMRVASRRAVDGHLAAERAFREGKSEFDIHLNYCRSVGLTENQLPYRNIIALNEHAAILHYQHQSPEKPNIVKSFLIDAGAQYNGYASDITRTYAKEQDEFSDLIARFDILQLELVEAVRSKIDFVELHMLCHYKLAVLIDEIGLAKGSPDMLLETGVTAAFCPHGLGHLLGIQVHDVGGHYSDDNGSISKPPDNHPFLRLTRGLEANQTLTIEPGIYVIDMLIDNLRGSPGYNLINHEMVDWLREYGGIRIEDNVRVLEHGCENLTRDAFHSYKKTP
ncbi:MAG: Xaa-Pro dipeptidase [Woeseia sp.]|nr:Xaa-Pro dipeptidase [Woeseia sp.]|tara:strand:+ start:160 stop:1518 length:1359 start_codon:yes stop_codon:yes gene_type:complete